MAAETTTVNDWLDKEQKGFILETVRRLAQAKLDKVMPLPRFDAVRARELGLIDTRIGGCFVTYKNPKHRHESLRGCMGCFEPTEPLMEVVESRCLASLKDYRFSHDPITAKEFRDEIKVSVSVLSKPVRVPAGKSVLDVVVVGVHGVIVEKDGCSGTYLPQVATEQGWDAKRFVTHCALRKAGIASADPINDPEVHWQTYTASIAVEPGAEDG